MNVKQELNENKTVLMLVPSTEYNKLIVDTVKSLSDKKIFYVTLNKTFDSLKELFEKKGINTDNIVFIDAISKTFKDVPDMAGSCYYCTSPGAFTELSLAIGKMLKHGFDYLIFDSITNLLVFERKAPVAKLISTIVNKARENGAGAIFYALQTDEHKTIIEETGMFVDKVIDVSADKKPKSINQSIGKKSK